MPFNKVTKPIIDLLANQSNCGLVCLKRFRAYYDLSHRDKPYLQILENSKGTAK